MGQFATKCPYSEQAKVQQKRKAVQPGPESHPAWYYCTVDPARPRTYAEGVVSDAAPSIEGEGLAKGGAGQVCTFTVQVHRASYLTSLV